MVSAVEVEGSGTGALLLWHGFTQSRWSLVHLLAAALASRYARIAFLDNPGHGGLAPCPEPGAYFNAIEAVWPAADLFGYSMGGRLALWHLASYPATARRAVVISAHPGLASNGRQERIASDHRLAETIAAIPAVAGLGVATEPLLAFLREWNANPLFGSRRLEAADLAVRLRSEPRQLASSLERFGTGRQPELAPLIGRSPSQILYIAGELDAAYSQHGAQLSRLPNVTAITVAGAAHDVIAAAPERAVEAIVSFLADEGLT